MLYLQDGMHSHTHGEVLRSDWWEVKEDGRLEVRVAREILWWRPLARA
jgi:hypothetical protein